MIGNTAEFSPATNYSSYFSKFSYSLQQCRLISLEKVNNNKSRPANIPTTVILLPIDIATVAFQHYLTYNFLMKNISSSLPRNEPYYIQMIWNGEMRLFTQYTYLLTILICMAAIQDTNIICTINDNYC